MDDFIVDEDEDDMPPYPVEEEEGNYSSYIRNIFGYDKRKYVHCEMGNFFTDSHGLASV